MQRRWAGWSLINPQGCGATCSGGIKRRKFARLWRLKKLLLPRGATGAPSCSRQKASSRRTELQLRLGPPPGLHSSCMEPDVSPFIYYSCFYASRQTKEKEIRLRLSELTAIFSVCNAQALCSTPLEKWRHHSYKLASLHIWQVVYSCVCWWSIPVFPTQASSFFLPILPMMRWSPELLNHILWARL